MSNVQDLERQLLNKLQRQALESQRSLLCSDLDPADHFALLRTACALTLGDQELVQNIKTSLTTSASANKFIDILVTKTNGFSALCQSLEENRTQVHLLEALNRALEQLVNVYTSQRNTVMAEYDRTQPDDDSLPLPTDKSEDSEHSSNV